MARKKSEDPAGYGRLLDAWVPPANAGDALGCFATTFTFHASFFETECLSRMLQLECDPDTSGATYLVEREEKMARLKSACVVVDQNHARGQRSLRWDLVPFRTKSGILHSKLSILLWQHHARVIVASANLTESGYRQNLEVFTVWDFQEGGIFPAALFISVVDYASGVLAHCREKNPGGSPALERSEQFLATARRKVSGWLPPDASTPKLRSALVPITPDGASLFTQLENLWPASSPRPNSLSVLSPFFDQGPANTPALLAWTLLNQRSQASIAYSVVAEPIQASGKLMVHAPASLVVSAPAGRDNVRIRFEKIKSMDGRPLHAKALWLENSDQFLHCIGSSNFTSAGLGLGKVRNWELNVASWSGKDNWAEYRARSAAWPEGEEEAIDPDNVNWEPCPNLEDESEAGTPVLPDWCGSAVYQVEQDGRPILCLNLHNAPVEAWTIFDETGNRPLLTAETWRTEGSCEVVDLPWKEPRPPTELLVRLGGQPGEARWPVEVRNFTDLPPPQGLRDLTLEQLLEILTSALPLHRCLQKIWRQNSDEGSPSVPSIALDPLRRFASDTHLLARTRRFSLALTGMRMRLESPIPSEEYLQWRLHGPIGVTKVAAAILKEATSDDEKVFLLGELALELSRVQPKSEAGCLSTKTIKQALRGVVQTFTEQAAPLLKTTEPSLESYVRIALKKALE